MHVDDAEFKLQGTGQFTKKTSAGQKQDVQPEIIDEHLFIEALALAAFEVVYKYPQPSNLEKVSVPISISNQLDYV